MEAIARGPWRTAPWFLVTAPALRSDTVPRERLDRELDERVRTAPITVVAAPSGFGKTIAVATWAAGRPDTGWLSATSAADTAEQLRGGLLPWLPTELARRLGELDAEQPSPSVLELLPSDSRSLTFVIDDAHLLDIGVLRDMLCVEPLLASGRLRLVLVGQPVLERHLAREIATGMASTVGSRTLAFTADETTLVARRLRPGSSADDATRIARATGGWPVATRLRLLAALDDLDDLALPGNDLAVVDPVLVDYVATAVLGGVPGALREFVLATTTCSRLDAALAAALSGDDGAHERLDACAEAGLFLDRYVDADGSTVYRWHDVFAAHVRAVLRRDDPDRGQRLDRIAAAHLAERFPAVAVEHALRGGVPEHATSIIRSQWLRLVLESQTRTLERLCLALPPRWRDDGDLLMIRACCRDLLLDPAGAELLRERAREAAGGAPAGFVPSFAELLLAPDPASKAAAADLARAALVDRGPDDDEAHGLFLLGWAEIRLRRDPERAVALMRSASEQASARRIAPLARSARANLAFALTYAGAFDEAEATLDAVAPAAAGDWDRFEGGLTGFSRGYVRYWQGDVAAALPWFEAAAEESGVDTSFAALARVYVALAVTSLARTDRFDEATVLLEAVGDGDKHGVPWGAYKRVATALLLAARGDAARAHAVAAPLLRGNGIPVSHALLAEMYRRTGAPALALAALAGVRAPARPRYAHVAALTTLAALKHADGRDADAHRHLERALDVAAPDRAYGPLLGGDAELRALVDGHLRAGSRHEQALARVVALRDRAAAGPGTAALTAREREVLSYLRTTMSIDEIAAQLHLSVATIKTHLRAIYRKLGVHARRDAVRVAR